VVTDGRQCTSGQDVEIVAV